MLSNIHCYQNVWASLYVSFPLKWCALEIWKMESICFTYLTITVTLPPTIHSHKMIFNISLGSGNITSHETHTIKWLRQNISDTKISPIPARVIVVFTARCWVRVIISDHWANLHSLHFIEDKCHPNVARDPWKMSWVWICTWNKQMIVNTCYIQNQKSSGTTHTQTQNGHWLLFIQIFKCFLPDTTLLVCI